MAFEYLRPLDRYAAGRQRHVRAREHLLGDPRTLTTFRWIRVILGVEVLVGLAAVVIAVVLTTRDVEVVGAVWFRSVAVLAITGTLFYFATRASEGYYWAYRRLSMFSGLFPIVTLIVATTPGLYPIWMVIEQIVFSVLMVGISALLVSRHMRAAFPAPVRSTPPRG